MIFPKLEQILGKMMKLTNLQIVILGGLLLVACSIFGATAGMFFWFLSTDTPPLPAQTTQVESTSMSASAQVDNTDEETAQCILEAFEDKYGEYFNLVTDFAMTINKGKNPQRIVRTEDPKKEIWIIESMYDLEQVTTTGKATVTNVNVEALLDVTTGRLTVSKETRRTLYSLGYDTSNLTLDLRSYCKVR